MASGKPHWNQHWIPKSYIAAWADTSLRASPGKRVHLYAPDGSYVGWRYPPQLFSLPDYYTLQGPTGDRDLTIEKALGRLESDFARTRRSILEKGRPLESRHRAAIAVFVAALRTRTPQSHEHLTGFWKKVAAKADRMQHSIASATPDQRATMLRSRSFPSDAGQVSLSLEEVKGIAAMLPGETTFAQLEVEAPLLAKLNLTVLNTQATTGFISSDRPVVWWDPTSPKGRRMFGLGLGNPNLEITVPISPQQCLLFTHRFGASDYEEVGGEPTDTVNLRTLAYCEKYWISNRSGMTIDWQ